MSVGRLAAVGVALLLGGCQTYMDARTDVSIGGPQRRVAAAEQRVTAARAETQNLDDKLVALKRDIERTEKRTAAFVTETATLSQSLEEARRDRKVSEAEYLRLKAELDRVRSESQSLDLQMKAGAAGGAVDLPEKQRQLADLERRKAELERLLAITRR